MASAIGFIKINRHHLDLCNVFFTCPNSQVEDCVDSIFFLFIDKHGGRSLLREMFMKTDVPASRYLELNIVHSITYFYYSYLIYIEQGERNIFFNHGFVSVWETSLWKFMCIPIHINSFSGICSENVPCWAKYCYAAL